LLELISKPTIHELDVVKDEMDERFREIDGRFDNFLRWIIRLILDMWTSIMVALILILLKILWSSS
jgi:hypothetical protein